METQKEEAYCLKDRAKCEILKPVKTAFANGTPILKGVCAKCGSPLFRILKKEKNTAKSQKSVSEKETVIVKE